MCSTPCGPGLRSYDTTTEICEHCLTENHWACDMWIEDACACRNNKHVTKQELVAKFLEAFRRK